MTSGLSVEAIYRLKKVNMSGSIYKTIEVMRIQKSKAKMFVFPLTINRGKVGKAVHSMRFVDVRA